ncbi:MAG: tRNA adenosine(34) deaminase TadA [Mariprofundaceae bacterium]|nr:tRNA adenosine(34) deaminase TadA [Mariprofundaceae bacterium]
MSKILDDEAYMRQALEQASLAAEQGEVPVGAVLVLANAQVFKAHNAPISQHDVSAHAEIQVMREACQSIGNYRLPGAQLFVTLEPCLMCAGAMIHARIQRVVFAASEPKTGAVHSLYQVLSDTRLNHQPEVIAGVLQEEASTQLKHFFKVRRKAKKHANFI